MAKHPRFDDQGAVCWFTSFAAALAEANTLGKRLFIEVGRES
jgi:hypothetical protein